MLVKLVSWLLVAWLLLLRGTCRHRLHNDPRPQLNAQEQSYVFAFLHAHQLAVMLAAQKGTAAMVSRSRDGQLIVPILRAVGCRVIRGSKRSDGRARGGREAVEALVEHVRQRQPAAIAVDGPRGPRGRVHKGAAYVAQQADAPVLLLVARPRRRLVISRAWDRLQIPWPLTTIDGYFSEPMYCQPGERLESFRRRLQAELQKLEAKLDPDEFAYSLAGQCTNNQDECPSDGDTACQNAA